MKPSASNKVNLALRRWKWGLALIYLAAVLASHIVAGTRSTFSNGGAGSAAIVQAVDGEYQVNRKVRIAYQEYGSSADQARPTVILVHGSPGHKEDFRTLAPELAKRYRVIAPDLPGFGSSTEDIPDYSIRAHARYVIELIAALGIERTRLLGFSLGAMLAPKILAFLQRVEHIALRPETIERDGKESAVTRSTADADRVARAALPFDPSSIPKAMGITAIVLMMLIAASTLVSEDLTCIAAGVMVAQGRIGFAAAVLACFLGIFIGDVLLFLTGRYLGRAALARAPLKWFVRRDDVERSSAWFNRRGIVVIAASRFVPGMRLPTYFAAGLLNTNLFRFSIYFLVAAVVWTPILVGLSSVLGAEVINSALLARQNALVQVLVAGMALYLVVKLAIQGASYRGRRLLVSKWRRLTRWEFWPMWAFYLPVICYVLFLALKHRSLTVFTAANPAIPGSGFIGESKLDILGGLSSSNGYLARSALIGAPLDLSARINAAIGFIGEHKLSLPVVLKPDQGQRGAGVAVIRSSEEIDRYLSNTQVDTIIQEYAPGSEFGVFYYRRPDEEQGCIFSITEKRMPFVTGDGVSTLEKLILTDERAVCMARFLLDKHKARASEVPAKGERVQLVEIGTHCRGALFLDGGWLKTPELARRIDEISRSFAGFYFGRFDIRTPSVDDFRAGRNFKIVELNGVTSEATHIYDPSNSLLDAYRVLFEQWRLAFEIGAKNRERGVKSSSLRELLKGLADYNRRPSLPAV